MWNGRGSVTGLTATHANPLAQVVTSQTAPHQQGGYWCDVCQCLLKDSMAYLDHINGKKRE